MAPRRKPEYDIAVKMHKKGLSLRDIAYLLGVDKETVRKALQTRGYDSSRKSDGLMIVKGVRVTQRR